MELIPGDSLLYASLPWRSNRSRSINKGVSSIARSSTQQGQCVISWPIICQQAAGVELERASWYLMQRRTEDRVGRRILCAFILSSYCISNVSPSEKRAYTEDPEKIRQWCWWVLHWGFFACVMSAENTHGLSLWLSDPQVGVSAPRASLCFVQEKMTHSVVWSWKFFSYVLWWIFFSGRRRLGVVFQNVALSLKGTLEGHLCWTQKLFSSSLWVFYLGRKPKHTKWGNEHHSLFVFLIGRVVWLKADVDLLGCYSYHGKKFFQSDIRMRFESSM